MFSTGVGAYLVMLRAFRHLYLWDFLMWPVKQQNKFNIHLPKCEHIYILGSKQNVLYFMTSGYCFDGEEKQDSV